MMVCCILLNQSNRAGLDSVRGALFRRYRNSLEMEQADQDDLAALLRPTGLQNVKAQRLIKFSRDWTSWEAVHAGIDEPRPSVERLRRMYGIGKYALDSYRMFVLDEWASVAPTDKELIRWIMWRRRQG